MSPFGRAGGLCPAALQLARTLKHVGVDLLAAEESSLLVPREEDDHVPGQALAGRLAAEPGRAVRPGHARLLANALRPDHDVCQVVVDVRECAQQLRVEPRRALVTLPALAA